MFVGKRVVFLLFMLVSLIIYTVDSFDYNKVLAKDIEKKESFTDKKNLEIFMTKFNKIKNEILVSLDSSQKEEKTSEPLSETISTKKAESTDIKLKKEEIILENPESSKTLAISNITQTKVIEKKIQTLEKVEVKAVIDSEIVQKEINNILLKNKIIFKRRSTTITKESILVIKKIAKILKRDENFKVEIAGHTDSRGKASLNKKLSQQRADSVRKALIYYGVNKERLTSVGYGEELPIVKDDKNGLSIINRRVEFNIVGE